MSESVAIRVEGVGKQYRIYSRPSDRLKQLLWGRYLKTPYGTEFWALRNIGFQVRAGETVGIVGRNGSGKSTLLQIIAGTLAHSLGRVETAGTVAALLELGSGFSPEYTGRDNVYLYGSIRGLSRRAIDEHLEAIIAFADIGPFIDRPVKLYSSGMMVRLAFATSIHVPCDVMIVDEALAVGDEAFNRKCFDRIKAFQAAGKTLLFVSHAANSVVELCNRAILIDQGELLMDGSPKKVIANYQRLLSAPQSLRGGLREEIRTSDASTEVEPPRQAAAVATSGRKIEEQLPADLGWFDPNLKPSTTTAYLSEVAEMTDFRLEDMRGKPVNHLVHGQQYSYCYRVKFRKPAVHVRFGMLVKTKTGFELGGCASDLRGRGPHFAAGVVVDVRFTWRCSLNPGTYFMNGGVNGIEGSEEVYVSRVLDALMFRVNPAPELRATALVDFGTDCTFKTAE